MNINENFQKQQETDVSHLTTEQLLELQTQLEADVAKFHNFQLAKKIQLNSAYGALANQYFRWYDSDHAEAITLSGQLSIRWIAEKVNAYLNKIMKTDADYILAIDTDSIYVNFGPMVRQLKPKQPIDFLDKLAKEKIEPFMKKAYDELAQNMNAYDNKMFMKREAIADKAIWRAKKNYIAHVWDNEGVRYKEPELKMMGIEAVRSSTPNVCREKIKETIKLIMTTDEETTRDFILKFKEEYKSLPFEDIASPRSVKKLSKYYDAASLYALGTPVHAKASIIYNDLLKKHKLTRKYSPVYDMDKVKWAYLKVPNPIQQEVIAAPAVLPREFGLDKYIDYDLMFEKTFLEPVKSILDVIGWEVEKTSTLAAFFE
jgi:DNA polymerase elongation subunit (family B)